MSGHCGKCGHTICICEELAERFTHDATCPCYECITIRLAAANEDVERLTWEIDRTRSSMGIRIGDLHSENEQLTIRLAAAEALLDSRDGKLLRNGKTFIVVAVDEPYFSFVYDLIRKQEKHKGRWTDECEAAFQAANKEVNAIFAAKAGGCDAP